MGDRPALNLREAVTKACLRLREGCERGEFKYYFAIDVPVTRGEETICYSSLRIRYKPSHWRRGEPSDFVFEFVRFDSVLKRPWWNLFGRFYDSIPPFELQEKSLDRATTEELIAIAPHLCHWLEQHRNERGKVVVPSKLDVDALQAADRIALCLASLDEQRAPVDSGEPVALVNGQDVTRTDPRLSIGNGKVVT